MRGNSCGYKDAKAVRKFAYSNTLVTKYSDSQPRRPAGGKGADPAAINSAIRNSYAKDRAKIKRLQQGLD